MTPAVKLRTATVSTLHVALGLSLVVHAAVLAVRFVSPPEVTRIFQDTPLEVILVNAHANDKPDKARAIAQTSLAGGGQAEQARATSPLPFSVLNSEGDSYETQSQTVLQQLQQQQNLLLSQVRDQIASLPPADPQRSANANPEQSQREEKRRQLVRLLAEIERRVNEENARPRKRYIGPSTREEAYAGYYDHLRRTIEQKGTDNFPEAGGRKLYGELTMMVTIDHEGRVLATNIVESSGNPRLDQRAQAIARSAGPFGQFSEAMRRKADQIVVVSRFRFTRDATLETRVSAGR